MQSVRSRRHMPDASHGARRHSRAFCACAPTNSRHGNGSKKVTNTNWKSDQRTTATVTVTARESNGRLKLEHMRVAMGRSISDANGM